MLLLLLCAAANDDYVALKAFYESTGGSGWNDNIFWDMSNTDVCGVPQWGNGYDVQCSGGRVTHLCASANAALSSVVSPLTLAMPKEFADIRRSLSMADGRGPAFGRK